VLALNTAGIANAAVTYDVTGFGADNSGATLATASFQACIDAVNAAGGGVANVPAGTYLIGTIVLKSGVTLNLAQGATLKISTNPADLQTNPYDPVRINAIRADGAFNIGITGPGVIDVQGDAWRASNNWLPGRPNRVIMPALCDGVTLKDFSVINSCGWTINPVACDNVTIDGVTVKSLLDKKMDDGIDLESCRHVEVNRVWVEAGDDAITIKTGAIQNPGLIRSSYDINIHDSYFFSNTASALKIGNENQQPIYDVTYSNIAIGTQHSGPVGIFGIACNANRGADIYNISYTNIVMNGVKRPIGISETKYDAGYLPPDRYGNAHDITLENITVTDALGSSFILAAPNDTIDNITLKNVNIHTKEGLASIPAAPAEPYANAEGYGAMPAYGIYARRVNGLRLLRDAAGNGAVFYSDVSDARPAVQFVDCANLDGSGLIDDLGFAAIQEDFNSGITGSAPLGWTASGTAVTVENLPSATDKSLRIYDNSLSASMFAQKTFVYRSSDTVVEYQVMLPRINGTEALTLRDAAGVNAITVAFDPAGNIYTYFGGTKTTVHLVHHKNNRPAGDGHLRPGDQRNPEGRQ
jgi:hypothetical protein